MSKLIGIWLTFAGVCLLLSQWVSFLNPFAFWFAVLSLLGLGIKNLI